MLRIALTGGGTGGHLYPLIAVYDALQRLGSDAVEFRYFGPKSPWDEALITREVRISHIAGSKFRRYTSLQNIIDIPKFFFGLFQALVKLYFFMPDAVFSKGGPGALPIVLAAAWYRIPVIIHESDAIPGLTNRISGVLARRIGIAFENVRQLFTEKKVFMAGNPVRAALVTASLTIREAKSQLGFDPALPLLLVLGGSQGAEALNRFVFDALPNLLPEIQVYHQTGASNYKTAAAIAPSERGSREELSKRYRIAGFLEERAMAVALMAADLVLTRAGAGAIYECTARGVPAILVPLESGANRHQHANAEEYAATGAAFVLEENNLTPNLAVEEIKKLLEDKERRKAMGERARAFYRPDAAEVIAREILTAAGAKVV